MAKQSRKYSDSEIIAAANYQLSNHLTIRQASKELKIPKSSLHNMTRKYLPELDPGLASEIDSLYKNNKHVGEVKGGKIAIKKLHEAKGHKIKELEQYVPKEEPKRRFSFLRWKGNK